MDFGDPIFLFLFIEVIVVLALLGFFLRKPRLAVVSAPPYAVRRDLAYRIRSIGYPVEVAKDVLRIRITLEDSADGHVRVGMTGKGQEAYRKIVQWIYEVVQGRPPET